MTVTFSTKEKGFVSFETSEITIELSTLVAFTMGKHGKSTMPILPEQSPVRIVEK